MRHTKMAIASPLEHNREDQEQKSASPIPNPTRSAGDHVYRLVTWPWFGFGISAASVVVAVCSLYLSRVHPSSQSHTDYSIMLVAVVAAIASLMVGLAARRAGRETPGGNATPQ